jgi:hypothetical protein
LLLVFRRHPATEDWPTKIGQRLVLVDDRLVLWNVAMEENQDGAYPDHHVVYNGIAAVELSLHMD